MQFSFSHHADAVLPFLIETRRYIEDITPAGNDAEMLLNKCKFILTELCTNGIKHSGQQQSTFEIYIENSRLVIQRKDYGLPFHAGKGKKELLRLPHDISTTVILTEDDMNRLTMRRIDEHSVRFYVEEMPLMHTPAHQMMNEHFGLIIISRSSDNFTYCRLPDGLNIFTVSIEVRIHL